VEARTALVTAAHKKSEDIRVQIRKLHQNSIKKGKYSKHSVELDEVCSQAVVSFLAADLVYSSKSLAIDTSRKWTK
jgi:ribosome recycling factor